MGFEIRKCGLDTGCSGGGKEEDGSDFGDEGLLAGYESGQNTAERDMTSRLRGEVTQKEHTMVRGGTVRGLIASFRSTLPGEMKQSQSFGLGSKHSNGRGHNVRSVGAMWWENEPNEVEKKAQHQEAAEEEEKELEDVNENFNADEGECVDDAMEPQDGEQDAGQEEEQGELTVEMMIAESLSRYYRRFKSRMLQAPIYIYIYIHIRHANIQTYTRCAAHLVPHDLTCFSAAFPAPRQRGQHASRER